MQIMQKNRLHYLDVLRGIAALAVCIQHIFGYLYHESTFQPLKPYFKFLIADMVDWGRFGVVLFFLISGYIIPKSLKADSSLQKFLTSRIFRLYPAYWVTLFLIFISASYVEPHVKFTISQLLANTTMIPKLFHQDYMGGVFWTLFIEILFYVCCVILFKCKWLDNPVIIGFIALLLNLTTPSSIIINYLFHLEIPIQYVSFHLSFLFLGNLLRLGLINNEKNALMFCWIFIFLSCLTIPISSGIIVPVLEATKTGFVMFTQASNVLAYCFAASLFIFAIYYKNFNNKFLVEIGEISYSLYLLHMLSFVFITRFISLDSPLNVILFLLVSGFFSYWVAKLSFYFIEYPAIQLGKEIIKLRNYA